LKVLMTEDLTAGLADNAQRYVKARVKHEAALRKIEGDATYEGQNEFFRVTEKLAREPSVTVRVLSREGAVSETPNPCVEPTGKGRRFACHLPAAYASRWPSRRRQTRK